jgi:DNA mismatch repair protein MutS
MRQYFDAKREHRDAILLFRMGDFYEMFFEDALIASRALDITLTSRSKDGSGTAIPMCGVPFHAVDGYLARLVKKGFRVAICEQVEDPRKARGVVRREVVRVVSPGTLTDAGYLDAREPAFMLGMVAHGEPPVTVGAALVDLSTGDFMTAEYAGATGARALADEIAVLRPREIVVPDGSFPDDLLTMLAGNTIPVTRASAWAFDVESARKSLLEQLRAQALTGFGLDGHRAAVAAAGGLISHLRATQKVDLAHVRSVRYHVSADYLVMDPSTLRHLEIVDGADGTRAASLLNELDRTMTAMAGRLLRSWLLRPLRALEPIRDRLDAVEEFAFRTRDRGKFRDDLKGLLDLERLLARLVLGTAGPRDLGGLRSSLTLVPRLREHVAAFQAPLVTALTAALDDLADIRDRLHAALGDELPALAREGGFIKDGFDRELDEIRAISRSGRRTIAEMEAHERERTGIGSLKIRYNRVFGYYIEISKSNLAAVPADYHRKQTIAGGERFITPALKEYEEKVLGADERTLEKELALFEALRASVAAEATRIQETARALATLDVLSALAETAAVCNYIKPQVDDADELMLADARHPVVERSSHDAFVPNDVSLNGTTDQLVILTGPNMGGKSTYLRQTAVIAIMAQAGSFVPARHAKVGLVDRVFARVGASDDIARGRSTFMVEMQETAHILNHATGRSLVILDEIGRGTSTFDGLSIAWAVAEHLATNPRARPRTLFATHYHELTDLADALPGVVNYHVAAREVKDDVVFLRKVVRGRSDRSYGIQVARLAGLPPPVVQRARDILQSLERDELAHAGRPSMTSQAIGPQDQLGLFQSGPPVDDRLARQLKATDLDRLTPIEALNLLSELKKNLED